MKNILFYTSLIFVPLGHIFFIYEIPMGASLFLLGLIGIFIFYLTKTIKLIAKKQIDRFTILLQILVILISPIFFVKYLYYNFGELFDYFALIIIPIFIFLVVLYFFKQKNKNLKLSFTLILFVFMTVPLFGLDYYNSPNNYIPRKWYNRYTVSGDRQIKLPYTFRFSETKKLSKEAFSLKKSKEYYSAIFVYRQAIKLEPENPELYFELSDCYARINELESAITKLDTAIQLDNKFPMFYNNRGLLYYKLKENEKAIKDYETAIKLDSTQSIFYSNLALVFFYEKEYDKACEAINKAEKLGEVIESNKMLKMIRKRKCN